MLTADNNVKDVVILIHGLWMPGVKLYYLGWKLKRRGFRVIYFHYRSMRGCIYDSAKSLRDKVETIKKGKVHLVGYSLGGIVVARMMENYRTRRLCRVALLGCPLQGSVVAEFLAGSWLGRLILGPVAVEGIVQNRPSLIDQRDVLVVSGMLPLGIGLAVGLALPHDGTVSISETFLDGATSIRVWGSHLSLVFSPRVADAISEFFLNGPVSP